MSSKCPKCGGKLKATYMKETCPHCGVNLLYYKLDERLAEDAEKAAAEVAKVERLTDILRRSTVKTPLLIVRLVLFFTPLLSMCLPMYYAAHKKVSLIGIILSVVNHGLDPAAWSSDYLFAVLAVLMVIVLSLAVILSSLFSATKRGFRRNILFSAVNTAVFGVLSVLVCVNGGAVKSGFFVTAAIYLAEILLHLAVSKTKTKKRLIATAAAAGIALASVIACLITNTGASPRLSPPAPAGDIRVISWNTASPWGTPFDDTASRQRMRRFTDTVTEYAPDLLGTQELNSAWLEGTGAALTDYEAYGVLRGGDDSENTGETNAVFWKKDAYTAIEKNTFWLSETPETESRFTYTDENGEQQEAGCNRICTYVILQSNADGSLLAFLNTHLDHASEEASDFGAALITQRIQEIQAQYEDIRIVLTGDFNQTSDGNAYRLITAVLNDTTDPAEEQATWQDWGYRNTCDKPIDFIFTSGTAADYAVMNNLDAGYASDHYGIMADITFE